MRDETIYALIDPRDGKPFYVGRTAFARMRLRNHLKDDANTPKAVRIREMMAAGIEPSMSVLDQVPSTAAKRMEAEWVKRLQESGADLTNSLKVLSFGRMEDERPTLGALTGTQIRMARAGLCITIRDLAEAAGVNLNTVHRIEQGHPALHGTIVKIQKAFEALGVEFVPDGVRIAVEPVGE